MLILAGVLDSQISVEVSLSFSKGNVKQRERAVITSLLIVGSKIFKFKLNLTSILARAMTRPCLLCIFFLIDNYF